MRNAPLSPESPLHASRGRLRAVNGSIAKSLRRFADYGELKKAALMVTAFQLDRTEIKQLKVRMCLIVDVVVFEGGGGRGDALLSVCGVHVWCRCCRFWLWGRLCLWCSMVFVVFWQRS